MKLFVTIFLCAAAVFFLYRTVLRLAAGFGKRELARSPHAGETDGVLYIYAEAGSLEYYIRCALMANATDPVRIVVNIRESDACREEMIDITERLARESKYLTYRLIKD